jgi:hypothetical protein
MRFYDESEYHCWPKKMFLRLLSVLLPVALVGAAEPPKMKPIVYRGGIITFRVPATWKEEYEAEGGGTFYDDRPDSGTLRLNVLTFKAPEGKPAVDGLLISLQHR